MAMKVVSPPRSSRRTVVWFSVRGKIRSSKARPSKKCATIGRSSPLRQRSTADEQGIFFGGNYRIVDGGASDLVFKYAVRRETLRRSRRTRMVRHAQPR